MKVLEVVENGRVTNFLLYLKYTNSCVNAFIYYWISEKVFIIAGSLESAYWLLSGARNILSQARQFYAN